MDIDWLIDQLTAQRRALGRVKVDLESPDEDPVRYYAIDAVKHYTQVRADGSNEERVSIEIVPR
jgi:hypothetical protein